MLAGRRMSRDFTSEPVDDRVVTRVAAAARTAPSAGNTDGLDLVVLTGTRVDSYWNVTLPTDLRNDFAWPGLLSAPVLMVPYVDPWAYVRRYGESDKVASGLGDHPGDWPVPYWWVDGGAAVMAMLLAAEAEGLGALFFGQFDHEAAVAELLEVPAGRRALGTIALGHRRTEGRHRSTSAVRGRATSSSVHFGTWNGSRT